MASADGQNQLGQVLIDFSTNGTFPEEESISAAYVQRPYLAPALAALGAAREELEVRSFSAATTLGTMKLTETSRQKFVESAVTPHPMLTVGLNMRSLYRLISIDQGGWQAPSSGMQKQRMKQKRACKRRRTM